MFENQDVLLSELVVSTAPPIVAATSWEWLCACTPVVDKRRERSMMSSSTSWDSASVMAWESSSKSSTSMRPSASAASTWRSACFRSAL